MSRHLVAIITGGAMARPRRLPSSCCFLQAMRAAFVQAVCMSSKGVFLLSN